MLLDPADAVLVYLFGFLWQHAVLEVRSVEAHRKSDHTSDKENPVSSCWKTEFSTNNYKREHVHLWPCHVQLVQDVLLHAGSGGGGQSHHPHVGELLSEFVQSLKVGAEIVTPLKDLEEEG